MHILSLVWRAQETEPTLNLQSLLHTLYERAGDDYTIDYRVEPVLR
ncbi:MAG TPA: DUF4058 family protein [Oscillatoriaceae cyanobacterium M7585_C2015_266]|nr:DUF4058 family protein [Oscillatoriaceae cyanobacterium M7585_C2015_266]